MKVRTTNVLISYLIFWFLFVVIRIQSLFSSIIEDILQKDLTLTNRTDIWDVALENIKYNFILGHGISESGNHFSIIYFQNGYELSSVLSAHNFGLQMLYEGGFLAIIILLLFMFISIIVKNNFNSLYPFFVSLMGVLIICLTEAINIYGIIFILIFCYYSKIFYNNKEDQKMGGVIKDE